MKRKKFVVFHVCPGQERKAAPESPQFYVFYESENKLVKN